MLQLYAVSGIGFLDVPGDERVDIIASMSELEDMLTTAEAVRWAEELGKPVTQDAVTNAARRKRIVGVRKLWDGPKAPYIFPKSAFLDWLNSSRRSGRPKSS